MEPDRWRHAYDFRASRSGDLDERNKNTGLGIRASSAPRAAAAYRRRRPYLLAEAAQRNLQVGRHRDLHGAPYCPPDRHAIREMGAKICFLGVPWDQGQMVRSGTSSGPTGHSRGLDPVFFLHVRVRRRSDDVLPPVDCGDVPIVTGNNDRSHEFIYEYITECLEGGAKVIFCGGDHSAPIPVPAPCPISTRTARSATCISTATWTPRRTGAASATPTARRSRAPSTCPTATARTSPYGVAQRPQSEGLV